MDKKDSDLNKPLRFLVKSSLLIFVAIILSKILGYVYRMVVARYYGPEVYGLLILSFTIFGWFVMFSQLGVGAGILRDVSFYRGKKKEDKVSFIVKFFISFLLTTGIIAGVILFIFSDIIAEKIFSNSGLSIFLKFFAFMLPLAGLRTVLSILMQAYEKIEWLTFLSKISDNLIKFIALVVLIYFGIGLINIPISYLVAAVITVLISYLYCRTSLKKIFSMKPKKDIKIIKGIFRYSLPLIFFGVSMSLITQADSFLIGIFRSVKEVGFYNAAVPIAFLLEISVDLFGQMFFPIVAKEYARGNIDLVKQLSQQIGKWVYIIGLPLLILFLIFPGALIKTFFGEEYLVAVNALRFLSIGVMFMSIFAISKILLLIRGESNLIFKDTLIVLVLNIILNLLLIPKYGINGAAVATMVSFILLGLIFAFQSWKYLKIVPLRRKIIRISIVALIPSVILLLVKRLMEINFITLIIIAVLFLLVYSILLLLTGCLDRNDKFVLDSIKRKLFKNQSKLPDEKQRAMYSERHK
ncbi:MAG: flippase [Nanoarchaeota archaeon]